jgi:hypothetical protein
MFQYAAARCLSLRHNTELKLDLSWLNATPPSSTLRRYELCQFTISAGIASNQEISDLVGCLNPVRKNRFMQLFFKRNSPEKSTRVIQENQFHFSPDILYASNNVYLDGYWQSEKYFIEIADTIRQEFVLKLKPDEQNALLVEAIDKVNAVSVHVRRGDYVSNSLVSAIHGTCSSEYFNTAMRLIVQQIHDPHFFVFSDDIQWCQSNINTSYPLTFVDYNGPDNAHEDLRLMSLCRHHVIANSSFSWWGAWLSTGPDKLVIAPDRWFNDPSINTGDLIPSDWQRL